MSYQAEALERTKLKFLGVYLQCGGSPGQYLLDHDETEEELTLSLIHISPRAVY